MNILLIVTIYAVVAAIDLYSVRRSGKGIMALHILCLVGSLTVLVLHDLDIVRYGPSHWIYWILK